MEVHILKNKWRGPKTSWDVDLKILDPAVKKFGGIVPVRNVLDVHVGTEVSLFIIDRTNFAYEISKLEPFRLELVSGTFFCPSGPVMFLLFWLPQPRRPQLPFASFKNTVNPHNPDAMQFYWDLARQTHWHVFVIGPDDEELNWLEFENEFKLESTLNQGVEIAAKLPCVDFDQARLEFEQKYSTSDLFNLPRISN